MDRGIALHGETAYPCKAHLPLVPYVCTPMSTERTERIRLMLNDQPNDCFLWHALGLEVWKAGDETEALQCFRKVLDLDEHYVGTYYHLGKLLQQTGQAEEAIATYEKGIAVAAKLRDMHARSELQMALDELTD